MGVLSDNFTAGFYVSFIRINVNLFKISHRKPFTKAPILKWPRAPQMKIHLRSHHKRIIVNYLSLVYIIT